MCLTQRARKYTTETAQIRVWRVSFPGQRSAQAGRYSLAEVKSLYGLPKQYLVIQTLPGGGQVIVSRHRKRNSAARVIERIAS